MTDIRLLKSKMALAGYDKFTTDLMGLVDCSYSTASGKINNKVKFTQNDIHILTDKLSLTGEEVKKIFFEV